MLFSRDSRIFQHLVPLRIALSSLASEAKEIETEISARRGLALLTEYRRLVRTAAGEDFELVESYWKESAKEILGALGEPARRTGKNWTAGVYRSVLLDRLFDASPTPRPLAPYPINVLNRLEPATGIDQEFAYDLLWRMSEAKSGETLSIDLDRFPLRTADKKQDLLAAMAEEFGLILDNRGGRMRRLFTQREGVGPFRFGIREAEGHYRTSKLSSFEFVIVDSDGRAKLTTSGPLDFAFVGFRDFSPGYGAAYVVFNSPAQMRLNVYAAFSMFDVLAGALERALRQALLH